MSAYAVAFLVSVAAGALLGGVVGVRTMRRLSTTPPDHVVRGKAGSVAMLVSSLLQILVFAVPAVLLFAISDEDTGRSLGVALAFPGAFFLALQVVAHITFRVRTRRDPDWLTHAGADDS